MPFKNKYLSIYSALLLAVANGVLDHYFAPVGILSTPFIGGAATVIIELDQRISNPYFKVALIYATIAVNDIIIKLWGGGIHDLEGMGLMNLMLIIGSVLSFFALLILNLLSKSTSVFQLVLVLLIFIALIYIHLQLFGDLGLGRYYETFL